MLSVTSAALLLFFVMDPLGNVPLFLSALRGVAAERHRIVIVRELVIALGVLVVFLFFGPQILAGLHVSGTALTVAGGVVLLLIALRMVFPSADHSLREEVGQEPFVVPLAIPYVAGPSALATVLLLTSREPDRWLEWLAALVIAWMASGLVLFFASGFARVLGSRGLLAAERLMGMLLVVVSVEMILSGLRDYLATLS
ncbi:MAG: MarC family protein [Gemmatimonadales bacterium]